MFLKRLMTWKGDKHRPGPERIDPRPKSACVNNRVDKSRFVHFSYWTICSDVSRDGEGLIGLPPPNKKKEKKITTKTKIIKIKGRVIT